MKDYRIRYSVRVPRVIIVLIVLGALAHLAFVGVGRMTGYADTLLGVFGEYNTFAEKTLEGVTEDTFYTSKETRIYFADGTLLTTLSKSDQFNYVRYDDIPVDVVNAFVAIEDKRFYLHNGVDWKSTVYAGVLDVLTHGHGGRGGSTITQQLARNKFLTFEKSYERKLKEILLALKLEEKFDKKQIMEFYVNTINFSNNYYGINAAALGYFHKDIGNCSVAEVALLCAIPNNPTTYNPRTNLENTISRRNVILREMYANGFIDRDSYLDSLNSEPVIYSDTTKTFHNYESSYAIKCTVEELMKANGFEFKYKFSSDKKYTKYWRQYESVYEDTLEALKGCGYTVKTSIDPSVQKCMQKAVNSQLKHSKTRQENGVYLLQGAATVIDNDTGYVVGIVGGRTQKGITDTGIITLNRAYQSYRQPGSTIKPLIVYAPSVEQGLRPDDEVDDSEIENGPRNADGKYLGAIKLRYAVEKSRNAVAWRLFDEVGVETGLRKLRQMQFSRIMPEDYNLAAALGGFTKGVSTVEMAAGYATLSNKGVYREPTCVVSIVADDGEVLNRERAEERVYSKVSAEYMTDILTGVAVEGTAAGLTIGKGFPIACKTGTTNNNVSGWFCGYSTYYTCAVYVGADDGSGTPGLYGAAEPKRIWQQIEESLCRGKKVIEFDLADIDKTEYEATKLDDTEMEDMQKDVYSDGNEHLVVKDSSTDVKPVDIQGTVDKTDAEQDVPITDFESEEPEEDVEDDVEAPDDTETDDLDEPPDDAEEPDDVPLLPDISDEDIADDGMVDDAVEDEVDEGYAEEPDNGDVAVDEKEVEEGVE